MFPKIIVTTGCSYGIFYHSLKKLIEKDKKRFPGLELAIDLHSISMGATFQTISIIECVDKLLNNGVNPSDIFVLAEFSQITRRDIIIANEFFVNQIDNTKVYDENSKKTESKTCFYPETYNVNQSEEIESVSKKLKVNKFFAGDFPKFENYYITSPENKTLASFPNKYLRPIFENYSNSSNFKIENINIDVAGIETINRAISYFENILFVQQYLKTKGIKYKFCLMQNQFSLYNDSSFRQEVLQTLEVNGEHYLNQDYINSKHIWDISNPIRIIKELIDWDSWWFYENKDKNIIWGGIDEYAIDKFGIKAFPKRNGNNNLFHQHPDSIVYDSLIKEELMKEYFDDSVRFI